MNKLKIQTNDNETNILQSFDIFIFENEERKSRGVDVKIIFERHKIENNYTEKVIK